MHPDPKRWLAELSETERALIDLKIRALLGIATVADVDRFVDAAAGRTS